MDRSKKTDTESKSIYRIPPYYYIHVLDQNSNVTKLEVGPQTFIRQDNEKVIVGPEKMIVVPPRHYCIVENPVMVGKDGKVVLDGHGQVELCFFFGLGHILSFWMFFFFNGLSMMYPKFSMGSLFLFH